MQILTIGLIAALAVGAGAFWQRDRRARRETFIREYQFPPGLLKRLQSRRPGLDMKDCQLVSRALRHFFLAYLSGGRRFVSMPSQVTDDLWHEFILYTRNYEQFCQRAFGTFLHHTPAVVLGREHQNNSGLRRTWWHACHEENISPRNPSRLPLLFAIDKKLNIPDGFHYSADCKALRRQKPSEVGGGSTTAIYCGGDFSDRSFDGTTDGFGDDSDGGFFDSSSSDSRSDGDSSGCGGGGCGGGGD